MLAYIVKRVLQMVPIVFGVILTTFILFHVVSGSPAALVLGKNASAADLEAYDEQRGYNLPLLLGHWKQTRALTEMTMPMVIADGDAPTVPFLFPLQAGDRYRVSLRYILSAGGQGYIQGLTSEPIPLDAGAGKDPVKIDFVVPREGVLSGFSLHVETGTLTIMDLHLVRATRHIADSQFFHYFARLCRLDLGYSSAFNQRVAEMLKKGAVPSLFLGVPILVGGLLAALVAAMLCAYYRDRIVDRTLVIVATAMMSINYIIWVIVGQYVFAYRLKWFPIWGFESWRYLILPVFIGIVSGLGRDIRFYRTCVLDELYKDYVRTAYAKGVGSPGVLFRHVLRNALIPVITNVSMTIPFLFTGNLLLESYFGIPGLGGISINAINSSDMDVVQAVVLIGSLLFVSVNLVTDLLYAWVDPRVRLE